jgi:extradiol dioxygenase family protein
MRDSRNAFHLAIPARDLDEAQAFYVDGLGCHLARKYPDRITVDFFGDQLVCHLSEDWERDVPELYPRHFGVTFREREEFEALLRLVHVRGIDVHRPCQARFGGLAEEHLTIVLCDPSNNLLEFKWYRDSRMIY